MKVLKLTQFQNQVLFNTFSGITASTDYLGEISTMLSAKEMWCLLRAVNKVARHLERELPVRVEREQLSRQLRKEQRQELKEFLAVFNRAARAPENVTVLGPRNSSGESILVVDPNECTSRY